MITNLQTIEDYVLANPTQEDYVFNVSDAVFETVNRDMANFANITFDKEMIDQASTARFYIAGQLVTIKKLSANVSNRIKLTNKLNQLLVETKLAANITSDETLDIIGDHFRDWISSRVKD